MKIQRYRFDDDCGTIRPNDSGAYVRYESHCSIVSRYDKLVEAARKLAHNPLNPHFLDDVFKSLNDIEGEEK